MSNPWFRLYAEMIHDEKIGALAFSDRWFFVAVMCLKCDETLDKYKGHALDKKVSWHLRISLSETEELKKRLRDEGLIDGEWQPVAWDKRQYKSDSSAERVAKHRAKKKQQFSDVKRPCNVTVTPPDTDTDTDNKYRDRFSDIRGDVRVSATSDEAALWLAWFRKQGRQPPNPYNGFFYFKTKLPPSTSEDAA